MSFLNQSNFPKLWTLFQYLVGTNNCKKNIVIDHYNGQKKILEIGCSVGNVSQVFSRYRDIEFTGIDIDANAIAYAKKRYKQLRNFRFMKLSLEDLGKTGTKFNFVLFANILHHVDDINSLKLLKDVYLVLEPKSKVLIVEPELRNDSYNIFFKLYYLLELGKFRRNRNDLIELVKAAGLPIINTLDISVATDFLPNLKVGRMTVIVVQLP
jgi:2-polyprenyl-3-methyl-5-hydroxy-6-metoxy-1,4-benzoquinol methylase